jgi:hypothetical protein
LGPPNEEEENDAGWEDEDTVEEEGEIEVEDVEGDVSMNDVAMGGEVT